MLGNKLTYQQILDWLTREFLFNEAFGISKELAFFIHGTVNHPLFGVYYNYRSVRRFTFRMNASILLDPVSKEDIAKMLIEEIICPEKRLSKSLVKMIFPDDLPLQSTDKKSVL